MDEAIEYTRIPAGTFRKLVAAGRLPAHGGRRKLYGGRCLLNPQRRNPAWLRDHPANTLYLCAPADEQARLRPRFTTLIREVVSEVSARAARTGKPAARGPIAVHLPDELDALRGRRARKRAGHGAH